MGEIHVFLTNLTGSETLNLVMDIFKILLTLFSMIFFLIDYLI